MNTLTTRYLASFQKYQKVVTLYCVEGWSAKILWEGFLVNDLLKEAGVNSSAVAAIFYASDGYSTELPLDYITNNNIIIAYKMNGLAIPPERGFPFELVAESQYGYKWIKWITKIELTDNPDYLGYLGKQRLPKQRNPQIIYLFSKYFSFLNQILSSCLKQINYNQNAICYFSKPCKLRDSRNAWQIQKRQRICSNNK